MLSEGKVSACRVWGRKLLLQPHRQHTSEDTACPEFSFVSLNEKNQSELQSTEANVFYVPATAQPNVYHTFNKKSEVSQ